MSGQRDVMADIDHWLNAWPHTDQPLALLKRAGAEILALRAAADRIKPMLAIARAQALEDAARTCDAKAEKARGQSPYEACFAACAAAIRALSPREAERSATRDKPS